MERTRWSHLAALAVGVVVGITMAATPASAARPQHVTRSVGPIVTQVPAGQLCDFTYEESISFTLNLVRFFDDDGNLTGVEVQVDETIDHRNVDTGQVLTEDLHYARHVDLISGDETDTGQTWQLRDESGRLVLSGAGLFEVDVFTGEVVSESPHAALDADICALLGGAAA